jgi:hypothetical protein
MKKQFIYFLGISVLMVVATIVVSAQMSTDALDNMTMNNSTLNESVNGTQIADTSKSNEAISAGISIAMQNPIQNENADTALNETSTNNIAYEPKNATSEIVLANNANITIETTQPNLTQFESPENTIFATSSGLESNDIFQISSEVEPRKAFLVSLPAKPIKDLGNMFFACNII